MLQNLNEQTKEILSKTGETPKETIKTLILYKLESLSP